MREVKFRAYVKDLKKVLPVYSIDFSMLEEEPITIAGCGDLDCGMCLDFYKKENVELMQYTGLKDKNGCEIFDGDILGLSVGGERSPLSCVVIYQAPSFCRKWIDEVSKRHRPLIEPMAWNTHIIYEVIGNRFENPELLAGDTK